MWGSVFRKFLNTPSISNHYLCVTVFVSIFCHFLCTHSILNRYFTSHSMSIKILSFPPRTHSISKCRSLCLLQCEYRIFVNSATQAAQYRIFVNFATQAAQICMPGYPQSYYQSLVISSYTHAIFKALLVFLSRNTSNLSRNTSKALLVFLSRHTSNLSRNSSNLSRNTSNLSRNTSKALLVFLSRNTSNALKF